MGWGLEASLIRRRVYFALCLEGVTSWKTDFLGAAACAGAPSHVSAQWLLKGDVLHGQLALSSHPQWAAFVKVQYLT